jgi:ribosome-associated heat shock protein Hsp15
MVKHRQQSQKHTQTLKDDPSSRHLLRLDKWLWAARFFKTRSLASEAIKNGKITMAGERLKPSKEIAVGNTLSIKQDFYTRTVKVLDLNARRGSAAIAAALYEETDESIRDRERLSQMRKLQPAVRPSGAGRPTKRERRQITSFTGKLRD